MKKNKNQCFLQKNIDLVRMQSHNAAKLWWIYPQNLSLAFIATLSGHAGVVNSAAFHPVVPVLATASADQTVKLWRLYEDLLSVTCVATLLGHSSSVNSVAFHFSAPLLASGAGLHDNNPWADGLDDANGLYDQWTAKI
jgi:WD40 repeat protein